MTGDDALWADFDAVERAAHHPVQHWHHVYAVPVPQPIVIQVPASAPQRTVIRRHRGPVGTLRLVLGLGLALTVGYAFAIAVVVQAVHR